MATTQLNPSEISELIKTRIESAKLSAEARASIYASLDRHWDEVVQAANGPGGEISRLVENWRHMVPLAQLESIARRGARKVARSASSVRAPSRVQR